MRVQLARAAPIRCASFRRDREASNLDVAIPGLSRSRKIAECLAQSAHRQVFDSAFFEANVALRLSNSSTFTPLRRMMKLCCSTESVLFQAQ